MAHYSLVENDTGRIVVSRKDFGDEPQNFRPSDSMRWVLDAMPALKPWQKADVVTPVASDATEISYTVSDKDIERMKLEKRIAITAKRDAEVGKGVMVTINAVTFRVDTRGPLDLIKVNGVASGAIVAKQAAATKNFAFTDADDHDHVWDVDQTISFGVQVQERISQIHTNARIHKLTLEAAQTAQQVHEYDFSGGW
jgi:hypothetical protein